MEVAWCSPTAYIGILFWKKGNVTFMEKETPNSKAKVSPSLEETKKELLQENFDAISDFEIEELENGIAFASAPNCSAGCGGCGLGGNPSCNGLHH